jgi:hypothetical protein
MICRDHSDFCSRYNNMAGAGCWGILVDLKGYLQPFSRNVMKVELSFGMYFKSI